MSGDIKIALKVSKTEPHFISAAIKCNSGSFSCEITGDKSDQGIEGAMGALYGAIKMLCGHEKAEAAMVEFQRQIMDQRKKGAA